MMEPALGKIVFLMVLGVLLMFFLLPPKKYLLPMQVILEVSSAKQGKLFPFPLTTSLKIP